MPGIGWLAIRALISLAAVAIVTWIAYALIPVNATTAGFAYLLMVLVLASTWGFVEAAVASVFATLTFNYFFFDPKLTLVIDDPQNWVALFSFLVTALIASRLSHQAKQRTQDAVERQRDIERLYTFSRAILLIESSPSFPKELAQKLADIFGFTAVELYDRRGDEMYRAGPSEFEGMDEQLRAAAVNGTSFFDPQRSRTITAVRLGSEPIASLALQGPQMHDPVLQGIGNLVAIGLERAKAQDLAHQMEAARRSEQLRTTLIDAMAHEFKTPLTSIKAATTSLLASPEQPPASRTELAKIADEEADHLKELIDNAIELARLDSARIEVDLETSRADEIVREVIDSMRPEIEDRRVDVLSGESLAPVRFDRRLVKLALKQLIDNALKYSAPGTPVRIEVRQADGGVLFDVSNQGDGIPASEQRRVFDRFYRSPSVQRRIPGSGLGLSIANRIAHAHNGDLTLTSRPGETTFTMILPAHPEGERT